MSKQKSDKSINKKLRDLVERTELNTIGTQIFNLSYPAYTSCQNQIKELSDSFSKDGCLFERDILFVYSQFVRELLDNTLSTLETNSTKLTDILSEDAKNELVKKLTDFFSSIPREYTAKLQLPMPSNIVMPEKTIKVGEDIAVHFRNSENIDYKQNFLTAQQDLLNTSNGANNAVRELQTWLDFKVLGYAGQWGGGSAFRNSIKVFKIAMQQLLYTEKIREQKDWGVWSVHSASDRYNLPKHHIQFFDTKQRYPETTKAELSIEICQFLDSHQLSFTATN